MSFDYLKAAGEKMLLDYNNSKAIIHNVQKGDLREGSLRDVLTKYLPKKYGVATGIIVDSNGTQSKQQDIIIYDNATCPLLINEKDLRMIPIESVYATIEVKSSIDKTLLEEACDNIASVKCLHSTAMYNNDRLSTMPLGFVFSYSAETSLETLCKNFISINKDTSRENRANAVCILLEGIIAYFGKEGFSKISVKPLEDFFECSMPGTEGENFITFYLILLYGLKQQSVHFPNFLEYAQKAGYLNNYRYIGEQEMPTDAFCIDENGEKVFLHTVKEYKKEDK